MVRILLLLVLWVAATTAIQLDFERTTGSNEITLRCRDRFFDRISSARFWVNSTDQQLTELLSSSEYTIPTVGRFRFTITPELEGDYFCGPPGDPDTSSQGIRLIGQCLHIGISAGVHPIMLNEASPGYIGNPWVCQYIT